MLKFGEENLKCPIIAVKLCCKRMSMLTFSCRRNFLSVSFFWLFATATGYRESNSLTSFVGPQHVQSSNNILPTLVSTWQLHLGMMEAALCAGLNAITQDNALFPFLYIPFSIFLPHEKCIISSAALCHSSHWHSFNVLFSSFKVYCILFKVLSILIHRLNYGIHKQHFYFNLVVNKHPKTAKNTRWRETQYISSCSPPPFLH